MPPRSARAASVLLVVFPALLTCAFLAGCSKDHIIDGRRNFAPETELTYAPLESDTTSFRVHLYWNGFDNDGEVVFFRFAIDADTVKSPSEWSVTTARDSIFTFSVDPGTHVQGHVFWIVAEDNDGRFDPTPAKRFFSARTLPPTSRIVSGPVNGSLTGPAVRFSWEGTDPDGSPEGTQSPVAAFEYILLRPGTAASEGHPPLPPMSLGAYVALINGSSGPSLPAPYDDWTWTSTAELSHRFTGLVPGFYVFAVRAVDAAGARQTGLLAGANIRYFVAQNTPPGPDLRITGSVLLYPVGLLDPIVSPELSVRPIEVLQSQVVSFAWTATPSSSGAPVVGCSFALDDTTTADWSAIDPDKTSTTLPSDIAAGPHFLFIRAVDADGAVSLARLGLNVVDPEFLRRPDAPVLWVDDFTAPGASPLTGLPNYPSDLTEDEWRQRVLLGPLGAEFGASSEEWDTYRRGLGGIEGRVAPSLSELARHRVVIWSTDLTNTSTWPIALWRTVVGGSWSPLANYVRGGGTLIVTGFALGAQVTDPQTTLYYDFSRGMCAAVPPGNMTWWLAYFPRTFMGVDAARMSAEALRTNGARDFVSARATSEGSSLGFQSAEVDTGAAGTGAKWDPYAFSCSVPDVCLAPGLPRIDGWKLATDFACEPRSGVMRVERPGAPIAVALYTYHGVNQGLLQDGGPSSREDMVVGIATQAHDLGESDGRPVTPGDANGIMGRMVFLGFPIYYMKDDQAYAVMRAAFQYVNASPTLAPRP